MLGIPVVGAFSVPLWVSSADPELVENVLEMQLETLGLSPTNVEGQHRHHQIVDSTENRTLLAVNVISDRYDLELPKQTPDRYEISPDLYVLPENQLVIWKELGKLVMTVTRGDIVVYYQALSTDQFDSSVVQEIQCVFLQLQSQGTVEKLEGVTLWLSTGEASDADGNFLGSLLSTPVFREKRPVPTEPLQASKLIPAQVAENRKLAARREKLKTIATVATVAYAAVVLVFAGIYFMKNRELSSLQASVNKLEQEAGWIPAMKNRWFDFQASVDANRYPVETLLRIYQILPPKGVRFKNFQVTSSRITITAEAQDSRAALRYKNALDNSPDLAHVKWDWTGGQPRRNARTKTADFGLTGTITDA